MARKSGGLGRDLYSLLDDNMPENKKNGVSTLRIADIEPRSDQPRKIFEREALETLAESIGTHGVLQPIIVRENAMLKGTYEIIAGERRWRASKMAGLSEIPVVILDGDDLKAAQVSIIENIQRENLNPVEEALAYRTLMDKFDLTQDQVAVQVGKSRSNVANMMRLLDLPDTVLDMLRENLLATGHARALLGLEREEDMVLLAERIVQTEMTVREVERAVKAMNDAANAPDNVAEEVAETAESKLRRVHMRDLERRILEKMGRKAKITNSPKKRVIELTYDSDEDLEDLLRALCGNDFFAEE
jgi:ParB family chromosome partitioning protein